MAKVEIMEKVDLLENGEFFVRTIETDGKFIYAEGVWYTPEGEKKEATLTITPEIDPGVDMEDAYNGGWKEYIIEE